MGLSKWSSSGREASRELDLTLTSIPPRGKRRAIEKALRHAIRRGTLVPGAPLPSTRVLARDLGVARGTVSEVYDVLVAEGWLSARQGSATTVSALARQAPIRRASGVLAGRAAPVSAAVGKAPPAGAAAFDRRQVRFAHDLRPGTSDVSAFPRRAWLDAARHVTANLTEQDLRYGDPRGHPVLRRALAEYLGRARGVEAHADLLVVTGGYTQALGLVVEALGARHASGSAPVVTMESPSSVTYVEVARRGGAIVTAIDVDEDGAIPATIDPRSRMVVLTPAHQYPTGATLSALRRGEVCSWVRAADRFVLEDDYDGEFRYDRSPIAALQANATDRVVYAGTASKTLAPALRLGWVVVPDTLLEPLLVAKEGSDRHTPTIEQLTLARLLTTGAFDRHVRRQRSEYRRRRDQLMTVLSRHVPFEAVGGIAAGLSLLVDLDGAVEVEARLIEVGRARGIGLNALHQYWRAPGPSRAGVVIGYATPSAHGFAAALRALDSLLGQVLGGHRGPTHSRTSTWHR